MRHAPNSLMVPCKSWRKRASGRQRPPDAAFARVSLREPTELNQLGFGRLESEAELSQPKAQRLLNTDGVRSILETDHKVIFVAHRVGDPRLISLIRRR